MKDSTFHKQLGHLKWFLKWANKKGYTTQNDYETFRSSWTPENRSYLDGWEPRIVEKLKIDPSTYKQRKSDIKNGQASESLLSFYNGFIKMLA